MKEKRIVICTGGSLGTWALEPLRSADVLAGADRGALFLVRHGMAPDIALGDFDSVSGEELEEIRSASKAFISYDPVDKDWTDTELAFRWALEQGPSEIVLLGALGTRLDHSLANIHLLRIGLKQGVSCTIIDAHNQVTLINRGLTVRKGRFTHVSLLPLSLEVTGIDLEGFQYPLHHAALTIGQSLGISNVLLAEEGTIRLKSGELLVIQSVD